jgi:hypothetical protein
MACHMNEFGIGKDTTHYYARKYGEWHSVMCCIGFATNTKLIVFQNVLQYYFSTLLQTGCVLECF